MQQNEKNKKQLHLSVYQKSFFLEWALAPYESTYNYTSVHKLTGKLNKKALKQACEIFIKRNEVVHAQYSEQAEYCNYKDFTIDDFYHTSAFNSKQSIELQIKAILDSPFDLTKDRLIQFHLIQNNNVEDEFYFIMLAHYIIADAISALQIYIQIENAYNLLVDGGKVSLKVDKTFTQAVEAEQRILNQEYKTNAQKFWLDFIEDIPLNINLPYRLDAEAKDFDRILSDKTAEFIYFDISHTETAQLKTYAKQKGTTVFIVLYALYGLILSKYSNQKKLLLSCPLNMRPDGFKDVIGYFVNTVPLKLEFDKTDTFNKLIELLNNQFKEIKQHQGYCLTNIIQDQKKYNHKEVNNFFNVSFTQANLNATTIKLKDIEVLPVDISWNNKIINELRLLCDESFADNIKFKFEYRKALFDKEWIQQFINSFKNAISEIISGREISIKNYSVLSPEEYKKIAYQWNATDKDYSKNKTVVDLFEKQVERHPDNIALVYEQQQLTYKELNEKSNQLANYLRETYAIKPGDLIGIKLERSEWMIIAILGILKLGGAYVPIDPEYPQERIAYLENDAQSVLTITSKTIAQFIKVQSNFLSQFKAVFIQETSLAYIIYTSGSTGKPKGVTITHQNVLSLVKPGDYIEIMNEDVLLATGSISFDISTFEIFGALLNGAQLVIIDKEKLFDFMELNRLIKLTKATIIHLIPTLLNRIIEECPELLSSISTLLTGGDKVSGMHINKLRQIYPHLQVIHCYGPTESTTFAATLAVQNDYQNIPIGKPFSRRKIYILDNYQNPCPIGTAGEIYIGGDGLSIGYLNRPELTKEKFIVNPFIPSERLYRSGDLGKLLPDGTIIFLGRKDDQVKIHGYRIELGEIEHALLQITGIKQCSVIAKERKTQTGSTKYLVGYYVLDNRDNTLTQITILNKLSQALPEYMLPSALIAMESLPLTINGKLDKRALPEPDFSVSSEEYVAPTNETEAALCSIWQEVLGLDRVGITDDFFRIGGNSILAIVATAKMIQQFNKNYPVTELLKNKTISNLTSYGNIQNSLVKLDNRIPETRIHHFEQLIFNHELSLSEKLVYNENFVVEYQQTIDIDRLNKAVEQLLSKNDILHSNYYQEEVSGTLHRIINKNSKYICEELKIDQITDLKQALFRLQNKPFDVSKDKLIRFYLITAPQKQLLCIISHHLIMDATSLANTLLPELYGALFCEAFEYTGNGSIDEFYKLSKSIEEYYNTNIDNKLKYWKDNLLSCEPIGISNSNNASSNKGEQLAITLDHKTKENIQHVSEQLNMSVYSVLFGLFSLTLSKFSGKNSLVIATNIDERMFAPTYKNVPGCFINNTFIINTINSKDTLSTCLSKTAENILTAINNMVPFAELLSLNRELVLELADIHFNIETQETHHLPYQQTQIYSHSGEVKNGLYVEVDVKKDKIFIRVEYQCDKYEQHVVESLLNSYINILNQSIVLIDKKIADISLLTQKEYNQIIYEWNKTDKNYPKNKIIYELFEEQVDKNPDNIALVYKQQELTYKELNEKSNQLARHIIAQYEQKTKKALSSDTLIVLYLDRSLEMIIGILAVLKAGAAYVPMDNNYPQDRIDYILEDTQAQIILSQKHLTDGTHAQLPKNKIIHIDLNEEIYKSENKSNLPQYNKTTDLAYVIYTSGTTGKPKGVMVEHKAFSQFIYNFNDYLLEKINLIQRNVLCLTNYVFDIFGLEYALPLITGGRITVSSINDIKEAYLLNNQIIQQTPSTLLHLVNYYPDKLSNIICLVGGEALPPSIAEKLIDKFRKVINVYGPAETVIWSSSYEIKDSNKPYIGKPLFNEHLYILDQNNIPVPIGVIGELYIGGAGLARGYLNCPELTAERFISNPFATEADKAKDYTRLYKTGDLVRWLPDSNIEYIARNDDQVKIRGYRIELAEIENALTQIEGIKQACVLVKEKKTVLGNNKYLVGYYVLENNAVTLTTNIIQHKLTQVLPDYMVPAALIAMESFPLTINGKLDKRALPDPDFNSSEAEYIAPITKTEIEVCEIWQKLLGLNKVGITNNFFKLGGNSILATQVSHRMSKLLGCDVKVADIFKFKTISELLTHATGKSQIIIPKTHSNQAILSFAQERLWFIEQFEDGTHAYHIPEVFQLSNDINIEGLKYALQKIVSRHEVLRSTIDHGDNQEHGIQTVHDERLLIEEIRLTDHDDYEFLIKEEIRKPFDLSKDYPIRVKFYTIESVANNLLDKTFMLINTHHIATDAWSMNIFKHELITYYEAYINKDTTFSLSALEIQYKDYAVWQRAYLTGEVLEKQLTYWKNKLVGYQPLAFQTDYTRPNQIDYRGALYDFTINEEISQKLRTLAQHYSATLNSVMLSSFTILLSKYTELNEIVIGSPISNRNHQQTENLIGFFVNTQVNRIFLNKSQNFEDLIKEVHQDQIEAQLHQDLPFEKLVNELGIERDSSKHPIFQVMHGVLSYTGESKTLDKQKKYLQSCQSKEVYEISRFDLICFIDDSQEELKGTLNYSISLFHKNSIERFIHHYVHLLTQLTEAPEKPYSQHNLLTNEKYDKLFYKKNAKGHLEENTILQLFEEQVKKYPENIALVFKNTELTYSELDEKSNQFAHYLQDVHSIKAGDLISIKLERSEWMIISILGVLKSGGAYIPLNPDCSKDRIELTRNDYQMVLTITPKTITEFIEVQTNFSNKCISPNIHPDSLAYVIHDLRIKNKEVSITHENVVRFIKQLDYQTTEYEEALIESGWRPYGISPFEIFGTLLNGYRLCIFKTETFSAYTEEMKASAFSSENEMAIDCSEHQKRLWFIDNFEKNYLYNNSPVYHNLPLIIEIPNDTNITKLNQVSKALLAQCVFLRTNIIANDGIPLQVINDYVYQDIQIQTVNDLSNENEWIDLFMQIVNKPFNIDKEILLRFNLVRSNDKLFFLIIAHHVLLDRKSLLLLAKDIMKNLNTDCPEFDNAKSISYRTYSKWQHSSIKNNFTSPSLYWKKKLKNTPVFYFETDKPRDLIHIYEGGLVKNRLSNALSKEIDNFCTQFNTNPYVLLLSVYKTLLYKLTETNEIVIGTLYENRKHEKQKNIIGPLSNLLSLKTNIENNECFLDYLMKVSSDLEASIQYADYPFEKAVIDVNPKKDMSRTAIFDLLFQYEENELTDKSTFKIIELNYGLGKYDVNLLVKKDNEFGLYLTYNKKYFEQGRVERFLRQYINILQHIVKNPTTTIKQITYLSTQEQNELLNLFNDKCVNYPRNETLVSLFEQQVKLTPDNTALVFEEQAFTYSALNARANQLADYLKNKYDIISDDLVGIKLERSEKMIISILGILKSGGAYVPIDPEYPQERIDYIVEDSKCKVVVDANEYNKFIEASNKYSVDNVKPVNKPTDLAYIIYTSGSTGKPKGVLIEHCNVVRLLKTDKPLFDFNASDVWTMFHSYCFDFSVWEMYGALLNGGKLIMVPKLITKDPTLYLNVLKQHNVTVLNQTPSAFYNIITQELEREESNLSLRYVIFGGEALSPGRLKEWKDKYPDTRLINMYGITETTVHVTYKEITDEAIKHNISNIGKPIPTLSCYVFDQNQNLLPVGSSGELYVGGLGVARGYLNRKELTSQRFIMNPYNKQEKLYRSGDKVRLLENGELEYVGRIDDQVKIRGYRIELGEIESALSQIEGIKQCLVLAKERKTETGSNNYLVGYYVLANSTDTLTESTIMDKLTQVLPEYMVPSSLIAMESFPLTVNGKLDKHALPDIDFNVSATAYVAPTTAIEKELCKIWQEVLGLDVVGITNDFFRIGGSSILAIQVSHRMSKALRSDVKVAEIFRFKNIASVLANHKLKKVDEERIKLVF